jgi:phage portal protein BeeE
VAVHNFYPVTDVELNGYPVTPLDTVMNAVTTHLNIEEHNKLYFQSGRAARGMLLIQSDDVDEGVVQNIKQQFQASINSVQNAWRMPVFGLGKEDAITWQPIDSGSRDMEFQYLSTPTRARFSVPSRCRPKSFPATRT